MLESDGHAELLSRYIDGMAAPGELASLEQWIQEDPSAGEALAEISRLDAWLLARFQGDLAETRAETLLRRSTGTATRRSPSRLRALGLGLGVAAAVLAVLGLWAVLRHVGGGQQQQPTSVVIGEVTAGQVTVGGQPVSQLRAGDEASAVGGTPATIQLADGSSITLEPGATAAFSKPGDRRRPQVELREGKADFEVSEGGGTFEVRTPLGKVTALGTAFSVALLAQVPFEEGVEQMKLKHAVLAVAVLAGTVQVDFAGKAYRLGPGDSSLFAKEGDKGPKINSVSGELTKVDAGTLTITQRGDKGEKAQVVTLEAGTKILIETDEMETVKGEGNETKQRPKMREGGQADLQKGQRVTAQYGDDGKATKVVVLRAKAPGGKEDWQKATSLSGELTKVDGDRLSVTRRGDKGEQRREVVLDATAKIRVETDQMESVPGEGGKTKERPKIQDGALSDLAVGKQVTVKVGTDGKAIDILIHRPRPAKEGKESTDKSPANKPAGERGKEADKQGKAEGSGKGPGKTEKD